MAETQTHSCTPTLFRAPPSSPRSRLVGNKFPNEAFYYCRPGNGRQLDPFQGDDNLLNNVAGNPIYLRSRSWIGQMLAIRGGRLSRRCRAPSAAFIYKF